MYTSFFGLSDIPFSIAPNPDYLFLSDRHKEALSHLTYGLGDTGGFVLLTGEVGTGKTTISRKLLEQLPENTQVAFILNPTLSCLELLATICDQLKIRYRKTGATLKYLTDKIQDKLIKNQAADINTILLIDEAQHLQPEVLEQLRLLTNLETNTKKLLQVILIGQPELQQLLQRRDLRQLAQRITARYHLLPLTKGEVAQYVAHRVSVADCQRNLFNDGAITMLFKISQGIPRITNLLCDRALALAYGDNQSVVGKKLIQHAATQALGEEFHVKSWWQNPWAIASGIAGVIVVCSAVGFVAGQWLYTNHESREVAMQPVKVQQTEPVSTTLEPVHDEQKESSVPTAATSDEPQLVITEQASPQSQQQPISLQEDKETTIDSAQPEKVIENTSGEIQQSTTQSQPPEDINFELTDVEGVSEDLLAKFQHALTDEQQNQADTAEQQSASSEVRSLMDMPASFQDQIPNLQFEQHIYASDGEGWVKVNGRDRYEGDRISGELILSKIEPQQVILSYQGEQFSLPALSNW